MRLSYSLIVAAALGAAVPAAAQNAGNAVAPAAASAMNPDANTTAMPEPQVAPPGAATPADTRATPAVKTHRGFPWGVVGLLGLIGLFGVRKVKG